MNRKYEISACGSGFAGRIATVKAVIEFDADKETAKDFYEKARHAIFLRGYNILHWGAINGVEGGRCVFVAYKNERLAMRVLRDLSDYKVFADMVNAIEASEKSGEAGERTHCYKGEWCYGGRSKDSAKRQMERFKNRVAVTDLVLDELGYDPADREGIKRVCNNIGIDAYPGNGTC